MKRLIMIIGVPGSGKTTKAKELLKMLKGKAIQAVHYEADMYFTEQDGTYVFDPSKLGEAHDFCQSRVFAAMRKGTVNVIVSNTFIKAWERVPYFHMALQFGYDVLIIRMNNQYGSVHGVPEDKIEHMKNNIEQVTENEVQGLTVTFKSIGGK